MEAQKLRLQRQQNNKKPMDELYSKFISRLQNPSEPANLPPTAAGSSRLVSSSTPSTSSGFVNIVKTTAAVVQAPTLEKEDKFSKRCLLCKTQELIGNVFVSHILGKKHSLMESKQKRTKQQKEERDRRTVFVSGFPAAADAEKICGLFLNLGMIDFHWASRHAFVEFSTRAEAVEALKKRVEFRGKRLSLAPRTQRSHTDDVVREEAVETLLTPHTKSLIATPCHSIAQVSNVLQQLLFSIQLRPDEYEKRVFISDYVARCLRPEFPDVTCNIFGSSANNLGFSGADLDLYAYLGYDPYDTPRQADGEAAAARLITHFAKTFRKASGVSNVIAIPKARVPIVKFRLCDVSVDLSFRNSMPIQNTALIRFFTSVHTCVRPYMMLIRFWAKAQNIAGGGRPATLLTNYALTMLMAFVLMNRRKILPPVAELRNAPYRMILVNGWNCGFSDAIHPAYRQARNYTIFELALDFFEYYANLDSSRWVVCPLVGRLVSKQDMTAKAMKRLPGLQDYCKVDGNIQLDTPLCVQDPFDLTHNITRGLTKIPLESFQLLCRRSIVILKKIMDQQLPPKALFDTIELSDDAYSSEGGISEHRLGGKDESSHGKSDEPEVIEIDDDEANLTQEVVILEKVSSRPRSEPEEITLDDDSSQGIKRPLTDDSGVGDVSMTSNNSTNSVTSLDQKAFLSHIDLNSPYLYRFQVPSDKIVELNMNTGALTCKEGQHSSEDVRWSGLNILTFVLGHIFAAGVISRVTEGESPNKKAKAPDFDSLHCFAILLVTFKHNLSERREVLMSLTPSYSSSSDSPFTYEKSLTDQLLKNIPKNASKDPTSSGTFSVQFFVCYRACDAHELLMVANESILPECGKERLRSFLHEFRQMTEQCVQRALQCLDQDKSVL